ncbi:BofC C-terminal domain-containing protein [Solibaculum mannosilyticum]|uniref:Bypass of forespore C C-terminal domain-containing protein n=1 Tax=Solibaculum mannosilyticum TaxID=2780922 RepID=A0A7I8CZD1_9FIRM|nr:BofC C-terminal domain-containing protein [Solibaculum mannosilyticum]MCO7137990.1 BofC C-terminal domain-containing protein [[Clostridium] leptum]BCI59847.1 hypothetical protein C12CBH8_04860 [Solibaculum mannosilyticum]CZT56521.1 hypothetical protein BN3661_01418 [Eubacteriaceae bacterium CHKCI005]
MGNINVKTSVLVATASLAATLCILMGASMIGSSTQASPSSSAVTGGWVMRDYQGKIAVFQDGNDDPTQVLDIYVNSLPEHDQDLLESGIRIDDQKELQQLIEDYTG